MSVIELIKYIFLGIIQGITKVLPISSSGHVAIAQVVLATDIDQSNNYGVFLAIVNFGSLIAVLIYFRKAIIEMIVNFFKYAFNKDRNDVTRKSFNYVLMLFIATVPLVILGDYIKNFLEDYLNQYVLIFVGIGSLIGATFLYLAKDYVNKNIKKNLSYTDSVIIGILQIFTAMPGLSRFAITTSVGMMRKNSMDTSLTFSIFLYIPISIGTIILYGFDWVRDPSQFAIEGYQFLYFSAAFIMSVLATYYAIKKVFIWFRKGKFLGFAVYSMILGFIALILGLMQY